MEYVKYLRCDIILVVAFCGSVMAIESANIVSYAKQVLKDDKQAITSGFIDISEIANSQEGFWLSRLFPNYNGVCNRGRFNCRGKL